MRILLSAATVILMTGWMSNSVSAAPITVAQWTFEEPPHVSTTGRHSGEIAPEVGSGTAFGYSGDSATLWNSDGFYVGNGSFRSWYASLWRVGDYYAFNVSTVGLIDVAISFDQNRYVNGPTGFRVRFSTDDGATWTNLQDYTVTGQSWAIATYNPASYFTFSLPEAAWEQPSLTIRLESRVASTSTSNSGARLDNFTVTAVQNPIPEPGAIGLLGLAAVGMLRRRGR